MLYGLDRPIMPPCGTPNYQQAVPLPTYVRLDSCADTLVYNLEDKACQETSATAEVTPPSKPSKALGGQLLQE
jgi:hypothetical protein